MNDYSWALKDLIRNLKKVIAVSTNKQWILMLFPGISLIKIFAKLFLHNLVITNCTRLQKLSKCEVKAAWYNLHDTWNQILVNSIAPKMSFVALLEVLSCNF